MSIPLGWLVCLTVVPAALIAAMTLYPIRRLAPRMGLVAGFTGHSTHTRVTPLGGGLGIFAGVVLTLAAGTWAITSLTLHHSGDDGAHPIGAAKPSDYWIIDVDSAPVLLRPLAARLPASTGNLVAGANTRLASLWGLMGGGAVLCVLGYLDDRRTINPFIRLAVEFAVAAFVVFGLGFELTAFISPGWFTKLLSMVWIVAVINSFNMLDNMDGLSGGVAAIIAVAMAVVMLITPSPGSGASAQPQILVASLLLVTAGSLFGFLWHNFPSAKIFMGDAGSYFVGYMIAVAMLMATFAGGGSADRPHAVLSPACAMAVPMYDMLTVIWIRIRNGKSIFDGDRNHFSHRLVDLGLTRTGAVMTIYLVTATCGLASIVLTRVDVNVAAMVLGIVGCMLLLVVILESTSWRLADRGRNDPSASQPNIGELANDDAGLIDGDAGLADGDTV